MKKIALHITNASKFTKASNLAIQLIHAGSVKPTNADYFFAILDAAMASPTTCNDPLLRADYHALFSAAQDLTQVCPFSSVFFWWSIAEQDIMVVVQCFSQRQQKLLSLWTIRAVMANDLFTDDSFVVRNYNVFTWSTFIWIEILLCCKLKTDLNDVIIYTWVDVVYKKVILETVSMDSALLKQYIFKLRFQSFISLQHSFTLDFVILLHS